MSKKIVIIESDASLSQRLRSELEGQGFEIVETLDGKSAVDVVRREKPDLVVLAVELAAGQSGYIVCGKLKKDDDLKKIPVVIIGKEADGFEAHKRLRARAEDYLKKPFEPSALVEKIGELIGLPEKQDDLVLDADETLGLDVLGEDEDEPLLGVEETAAADGEDNDLEMLDAAFDGLSDDPASGEQPVEAPPDDALLDDPPMLEPESLEVLSDAGEEAEAAFDGLQIDDPPEADKSDEDISLDALEPLEEPAVEIPVHHTPAPSRVVARQPTPAPIDDGELRSLRERVAELEGQKRELEDEVAGKTNELEALRATTGNKDKDYFDLREQSTRKDKEIVQLKQQLNEKEQEVIELREKENQLERRDSEFTTEMATKDAQVKTLTHRAETLTAERKRVDLALNQAKDEIRQLNAKLSIAQGELDQAQDGVAEIQSSLDAARAESAGIRGELEAARSQLEALQSQLETANLEAEQARSEAESAAAQFQEEGAGLRRRIAELEEASTKNEDRIVKAYQKIKADEKLRERARKALTVAIQALDENSEGLASDDDGAEGRQTAS